MSCHNDMVCRGDDLKAEFGVPYAAACISGKRGSCIDGSVRFYRRKQGTLVVADISGLPESEDGFYGFHIHEGGNCRGEGFANTGGHFNPAETVHPCHAGDLPPLLGCKGKAYLAVWTIRFSAEEIVGRTVVIHSHSDDFRSQPSGDSGEKIACGVIRIV